MHLQWVYPAPRREPGRGVVWEARNGEREWKKKWGNFVRTGVGGVTVQVPGAEARPALTTWACSKVRRSLVLAPPQ